MKKILMAVAVLVLIFYKTSAQQTIDTLKTPDSLKTMPPDTAVKQQTQPKTEAPKQQGTATAQASIKKDTRPFMKRWTFDIGTGFWTNTSGSYFEISPTLTYHFPKIWAIGGGPTYVYRHNKDFDEDLNGFGGKLYAQANLTKWFYAWTEYQGISNQYIVIDDNTNKIERQQGYVDSWFLSLGIHIRRFNAQALYDVLYDKTRSPYGNAWTYRIGFGF